MGNNENTSSSQKERKPSPEGNSRGKPFSVYEEECLCMRCGEKKPLAEFRNDANVSSSFRPYCVGCYDRDLRGWRAMHYHGPRKC